MHQVAKVLEISISPSNEYSGLISFLMGWLDLLAVQVTLKSLLQHHSLKASIFSSLLYGPTLKSVHDYWKNHSFDYMDFDGEIMSLLFKMLSRFVIGFLPKSRHLLTKIKNPLYLYIYSFSYYFPL